MADEQNNLYIPDKDQRTIRIGEELNTVNSARLGSQVRSAIAAAISKIASAYETVIANYVKVAEDYGTFNSTVKEAKSTLNKFNTIDVAFSFVDSNGNTVPSTDQLASRGSVEYSTEGIGDNAKSKFTFKLPFGKGDAGTPGSPGSPGKNGLSVYVKYSVDSIKPINDGGAMQDTPTDKSYWIGICNTDKNTKPNDPNDYKWFYAKGPQGNGAASVKSFADTKLKVALLWKNDADLSKAYSPFASARRIEKNKVFNIKDAANDVIDSITVQTCDALLVVCKVGSASYPYNKKDNTVTYDTTLGTEVCVLVRKGSTEYARFLYPDVKNKTIYEFVRPFTFGVSSSADCVLEIGNASIINVAGKKVTPGGTDTDNFFFVSGPNYDKNQKPAANKKGDANCALIPVYVYGIKGVW